MANEPEEERTAEADEGGPVKSFLEHLEDLRWVLIKSSTAIAVTMLLCLISGNYVIGIIKRPLEKAQIRFPGDDKLAVLMFGTNRFGTYHLDIDQWDTLNSGGDHNFPSFAATNLNNLKSFADRLKQPGKSDHVSQYLKGQLSAETVSLLANYTKGTNIALQAALIADLNRVIQGGSIYDSNRFVGIELAPGTASLLAENPQGAELAQLNRRLLLHAYPRELSANASRFLAVQFEPRNDGENLSLRLRVESGASAERLARQMKVDLNTLSPAGGFFVAFQVAFYGGLALSSPLILLFIGQFVFPALKIRERHYVYRALWYSVPLFMLGVSFCYFVLLPVALAASQLYSNWLGLSANIWRAEDYISFVCKFMLGMGLGFQMPVVILVLVKIGILNYTILSKARRYMIVINLILGALLTTPEVLTQILMAVPLQLLYEITVWIAWYWERKEKKRRAAEPTE